MEATKCECSRCRPADIWHATKFYVCPICGNKRCPHNEWHEYVCTGSNELGQVGKTMGEAIARDYVISRMPEMRIAAARGANRIECNVYIYEGDDTRLGELSAPGLKRAFNILGFFVENYTNSVASRHFELLWM